MVLSMGEYAIIKSYNLLEDYTIWVLIKRHCSLVMD